MSIHRHDCGKYFPCGCVGSRTHTGKGAGEGYNVNIPWNNVSIIDNIFIPVPFSLKPSNTVAHHITQLSLIVFPTCNLTE